jgi:hypothetical protein
MHQRGAFSLMMMIFYIFAHPGQAGTEMAITDWAQKWLVQLTSASMAATFGLRPSWNSLARTKRPIISAV